MANNEDVNQAYQGAPAADIPDLKKKEKERKKAGAAWSGAKPGGGSFSGATGGTVARSAASAASSAGGVGGAAAGAAQAAGTGWLSSMIATMTATVLGKAVLAAGVAMFLAGAGLFGYAMFKGGGAAGAGGIGDLGAISSSMKVRSGDVDRTGYIASNGEIMFDPIKAAEAKKAAAAEKAPEEKTAEAPVPPDMTADAAGMGNRPGLEHNLSGAKLSSSLGGGFGGKNIFAGSNAAPKFNEALAKANIKGGEKGRLSASRAARTGRTVSGGKAKSMKANKAFGQLKVAKGMSALGAGNSATEGAAAAASNAFDGGQGDGNVVGAPSPTGAVDSPSTPNGAPDMTAPSVDTPVGALMDPDNAQALAGIASLAKAAGEMKKKAEQMMMMGLALVAAGIAIMCTGWPWCIAIGAVIMAVGLMLVNMSNMMKKQAEMMKQMSEQMSQALAARTSDVKQNEINQYCIDKAYSEGTDPKNCNPPDSVTENRQTIENDNSAVERHKDMVKETGRVEGMNGKPTGQ